VPKTGIKRPPSEAKASIVCDDMWVARELARAQGGLIALPRFLGEPDVQTGRLTPVLPEWSGGVASVYLVRPGGRSLPARALLLRKAIFEHLREHPLR
jgi:DNA-binding transcriptional LysR family regulator